MSESSEDTKRRRVALLIPAMMMVMVGGRLLGHPSRSAPAWDNFFSVMGGVSMFAGIGVLWKVAAPNARSAVIAGVVAVLTVMMAVAMIYLSAK